MIQTTLPTTEIVAPFVTTIGANKGKPRSRVWLEGKRLVEAGFTVGARYARIEGEDSITLILQPDPAKPEDFYKVSGKGEKPVIDITGNIITRTFPNMSMVIVTFESTGGFDTEKQTGVATNLITIRPTTEEGK